MVNKLKTLVVLLVLVFLVVAGYAISMNWSVLTDTFFRFPVDYLLWYVFGIATALLAIFISPRISLPTKKSSKGEEANEDVNALFEDDE